MTDGETGSETRGTDWRIPAHNRKLHPGSKRLAGISHTPDSGGVYGSRGERRLYCKWFSRRSCYL